MGPTVCAFNHRIISHLSFTHIVRESQQSLARSPIPILLVIYTNETDTKQRIARLQLEESSVDYEKLKSAIVIIIIIV